jgi:hypothetical protein
MKAVIIYDDFEYATTKTRIEADATHYLALDSQVVELDLSDLHLQKLRELLEPWFKAGHKPTTTPALGARRGRRPASYYAGLQEYAAERGIELSEVSGKLVYPPALRREYEAHLAAA